MFKGSIPALVTPMRDDGAIDFEAWDRLLDFHVAEGTDAVVVGGTTGESPALERSELEELIRRAKARVGGRIPVIAGSGTAGTAKSVALSRAAEAAGADALAGRHAVLQPADAGRPVPAFHGDRRRSGRSADPLQRAGTDRLRPAAGDDRAAVGPPRASSA